MAQPIIRADFDNEAGNALERDQCRKGFKHTREQVILWLCRCDREAINDFHQEWLKTFDELQAKGRA